MPVYAYRALNDRGRSVKGVIDADTPQLARQKLRADGLHPVELQATSRRKQVKSGEKQARRRSFGLRASRRRFLADLTRQTATLLGAGLPLVTALSAIQEQTEDHEFGRVLALIREEVSSGESLASALAGQPDIFPNVYVHMVRAGELSGALDAVLERLADSLEKSHARRAAVQSALAYPAFMTLVGTGVLLFLLTYIVPTLTGLFDNLGAALPWPTRLLLFISGTLQQYWWAVLIIIVALILLARKMLKNENTYRRLERRLFRLPLIGSLYQKLLLAQVLRQISVMTGGGVALTTALTVTAQGMGRSVYGEAMTSTARLVGQGAQPGRRLRSQPPFPPGGPAHGGRGRNQRRPDRNAGPHRPGVRRRNRPHPGRLDLPGGTHHNPDHGVHRRLCHHVRAAADLRSERPGRIGGNKE